MSRSVKHTLIVLLVSLCLAVMIRGSQYALDRDRVLTFVDRRIVFLPKGEALKAISMGYRSLIADWLWIRCVLYYGRRIMDEDNPYYRYAIQQGQLEAELSAMPARASESDTLDGVRRQIGHLFIQDRNHHLIEYIYPMLDRVVTVDPHFIFPYLFGGVYVLMDTGEIDQAFKLLEKGRAANPNHWQFPFYMGWVEWMYRGNETTTIDYLLTAVTMKDCPKFVSELLAGLSRNLGRTETTVLYLEGLLESSDNPRLYERIHQLIEEMSSYSQEK